MTNEEFALKIQNGERNLIPTPVGAGGAVYLPKI